RDSAVMNRGKTVFAENCAACHSSKQPPERIASNSDEARQWYRESVMRPDFREDNFLSNDKRYPVSRVKTNACRAMASNATAGHIWANFSSDTYKTLEPVGLLDAFNPIDESSLYRLNAPAGGVGYYRPPSLISIWSSAPFLHNNALGSFTGDPSVAGRMQAFNDAIEKLLWPERRAGKASIWVTTRDSFLKIPEPFVPELLRPLCRDDFLRIGPIPQGTPINLLANFDPDFDNLLKLAPTVNALLAENVSKKGHFPFNARSDDKALKGLVGVLMSASKCPDLIEDHGHEFGANLPDSDKRALIEFLKTL
ncbi:MAG TPA: hypothetical protein VGR71_08860, partial [Nitrospira sp.]|nr:hypothetical protein [Nitrospira sp.]